jgi:uncharacterized OB-fold protein
MTTPEFPAPVEDPDSAPYWNSLREHAMCLPYCAACGRFFFYPRTVCPRCHSGDVEWRQASGHGVIYSYTVVRRAPARAFAADVPYTVALADLDEGCRIVARVRPDDAPRTAIGARVQIDYHDVTDTLTLPVLRLVAGAGYRS